MHLVAANAFILSVIALTLKTGSMASEKHTVVVIGNGMVGFKFCEKLLAKSTQFNIIVFGEESRPAYDRVHLSEYFNGKSADDLSLSPIEWYHKNNIKLCLGDPVQEIDRENKTVHSSH